MSARPKTDVQIGNRYGELTVLALRRKARNGGSTEGQAQCACVCGKISWYSETRLRYGRSKVCRSCTTKRAWRKIPRFSIEEIRLRISEKNYRQGAIKRKLIWGFDREEFRTLLQSACAYCGLSPAQGIDRRDNSKGYTLENSVACCSQCNYAKRNQTEAEFFAWLRRIAQHQGSWI